MKIRPVEDELFHADGRRDMKKLTAAFRTVAKATKMWGGGGNLSGTLVVHPFSEYLRYQLCL
jgi:hypothetical protein